MARCQLSGCLRRPAARSHLGRLGRAVGVCFDQLPEPNPFPGDLLYTAYNTLNNLSARESTDGTCSGAEVGVLTAVVALDAPSALTVCQSLDPGFSEVGHPPPGVLVPDPGPFFFTCIYPYVPPGP